MKQSVLILLLAAAAAGAQTTAKPATAGVKTAAKPAATAPKATAGSAAAKLPPGVPPVAGPVKSLFALRYQDTKIGTGAEAEPNKVYWVHYTGWLAADGHKFDSSFDHPASPVMDHDLKPVMDADGKPKSAAAQPILFPQGFGRVIPGWDQGFEGMKIGGKRRLFIPYQLAYGARGRPTGDPKNPGIPAKADLIFDIELVDVSDMPAPPANHPQAGGMPPARPAPAAEGAKPAVPAAPAPAPAAAAPAAAPAPAAATPAAAPATQPK